MAISYTDDLQIRIDDYKRARTDIQQRTASQISREMEPLEEDIQMVEYINSMYFKGDGMFGNEGWSALANLNSAYDKI